MEICSWQEHESFSCLCAGLLPAQQLVSAGLKSLSMLSRSSWTPSSSGADYSAPSVHPIVQFITLSFSFFSPEQFTQFNCNWKRLRKPSRETPVYLGSPTPHTHNGEFWLKCSTKDYSLFNSNSSILKFDGIWELFAWGKLHPSMHKHVIMEEDCAGQGL